MSVENKDSNSVENCEKLREIAERTFRIECIETLTSPPCDALPASFTRLNAKDWVHDVTSNLDYGLEPMEPSTSLNPHIDEAGNIIEFIEEARSCEEFGQSTVSMSLNRAPFKQAITTVANSIRGSSSNIPFLPGFIENLDDLLNNSNIVAEEGDESEFLDFSSNLLTQVPALGEFIFSSKPVSAKESERVVEAATFDLDQADMFDLIDFVSSGAPIITTIIPDEETTENQKGDVVENGVEKKENEEDEEIDKCVMEPLFIGHNDDTAGNSTSSQVFEFARRIETNGDFSEYKQLVPTMARKFPFELDPFQQASVLCMERGESLFVAAHTSAGKTAVAEYAIAMCKMHKTRAIYTSPIKALSNQKFRDFKQIFDDVGLVTGDIQLHPEAFCIIMTTEILRSMLYNGSEVIRDLEWVVFDEVHYINNEERGHVWEEVLIMLPAHVKIVMLSATVPNCVEFADWVGRIKNRRINVISTYRRPVPLEHYLYTGQDGKTQKDLFKIIDSNGEFLMKGYNDAKDAKAKIYDKPAVANGGGRGGVARGGGQQRGAGANRGGPQRGGGHGGHGGQGGGKSWPGKNDKNIYHNLINYMRNIDELPMVAFVFSRKRCDENAQLLMSMDLTSESEKSHVRKFFSQCIERLKGSDKQLPQVLVMRELCLRGFAVHHSGILPILKEVVELLFQQGFVKILFATETFSMGVNMPARCVVFDNIIKHDGQQRRLLNPGEYIQMAGRAGRRGLDPTGTVIVLCKDATVPMAADLQNLMTGSAQKLESKFRVTYSMLLNLLRVEQLRIEDMLQRSYVESSSLREARDRKSKLKSMNEQLELMRVAECSVCEPQGSQSGGLRAYHDALLSMADMRSRLWPRLTGESSVNKLLVSGRYLIVSSAQQSLRNDLVLLLKELASGSTRSLQVLVATSNADENYEVTAKANGFAAMGQGEKDWETEQNALLGMMQYGTSGARVHTSARRHFRVCEVPMSSLVAIVKKSVKGLSAAEIFQEDQTKKLPRFRNQPVSDTVARLLQQIEAVSIGLTKNESEVYPMVEFVKMCNNIEISDDASMVASYEIDLDDPSAYPARHCVRLEEHFLLHRERVKVEQATRTLKYALSSDALLLSEEYQNRLKVLEKLNYVENEKMVSLKGRVACEIHHQELLITELILDNKFTSRSSAELAALLSTLTCQYNCGKEVKFEEGTVFYELKSNVVSAMERLEAVAVQYKAQIAEVGCEIRFDLMEVVYHWASGVAFSKIMEMTDAQEGLIVKCIQRLDEVCKDVRNAGRIVGHPALVEKMEEVSASIRRDIVFAASLYTSV